MMTKVSGVFTPLTPKRDQREPSAEQRNRRGERERLSVQTLCLCPSPKPNIREADSHPLAETHHRDLISAGPV
jgi:hypothetical protein